MLERNLQHGVIGHAWTSPSAAGMATLFLAVALVTLSGCRWLRQREAAPMAGAPAAVQEGLRLKVNLPAFRLVVWRDGQPIKTYPVAIGRKEFSTETGERAAGAIIWNPDWVPPRSPWVLKMKGVKPGVRIKAADPRNPLGKIKIPLGGAYLIHQAERSSDLGRLVSHGCIRMRLADLRELAELILEARFRPVSNRRLGWAYAGTRPLEVKISPPIPVEIVYETIVIEQEVLHLYADVYQLGMNSVGRLRGRLSGAGVDVSRVGDETLRQLIRRAQIERELTIPLEDVYTRPGDDMARR